MEKRTIDWDAGAIVAIDQCALPHADITLRITDVDALIDAITRLAVRGAPALGGAGALGVALLAQQHPDNLPLVRERAEDLAAARPTAANLRWGVTRALARLDEGPAAVLAEALAVLEDDETANRQASYRAADEIRDLCERRPLRILTHCNAGRLATVAWGTALGAVRALAEAGDVNPCSPTRPGRCCRVPG